MDHYHLFIVFIEEAITEQLHVEYLLTNIHLSAKFIYPVHPCVHIPTSFFIPIFFIHYLSIYIHFALWKYKHVCWYSHDILTIPNQMILAWSVLVLSSHTIYYYQHIPNGCVKCNYHIYTLATKMLKWSVVTHSMLSKWFGDGIGH